MKAYVITTGLTFGLIVVAHLWRMIMEGPVLAKDPVFIVITAVAAILCLWSLRVFKGISGTSHN